MTQEFSTRIFVDFLLRRGASERATPCRHRSVRRLFSGVTVLLAVAILAGCSAARLGYRNGETLSYFWLDHYVDFEADQKPWVRDDIDTLFAWHRRTQLPGYIAFLDHARQHVEKGVTEAQLRDDYQEIRNHLLGLTDHALPQLAELALALSPHQIAHLQGQFTSNNEHYRKEFLRGDIEERQRRRYKRLLKQVEYWFGPLDASQERALRVASDARPLETEQMMEDRQEWQSRLLTLLRKIHDERPSRQATQAMLGEYARAAMDHFGNAQRQAAFAARNEENFRLIAQVINGTTAEQKRHFMRETQQWIDDFRNLSSRADAEPGPERSAERLAYAAGLRSIVFAHEANDRARGIDRARLFVEGDVPLRHRLSGGDE